MYKNLIKNILIFTICIFLYTNIIAIPQDLTVKSQVITCAKEDTNNLPPSFNWCDIDGIDYSTSIKNQAPCPSCEAYALVASLETIVQYKVGKPFNCDLSEMHLFLCSGGTCEWGVDIKKSMRYLEEYGVPDEGCFPDPGRSWDTSVDEALPGWENRTVKIETWGWVDNNVDSIKQALIDYGPLVVCVIVRTDFMSYKRGIYRNLWGTPKGGHVITIFGYDDNQQCWLIKNSWGESWGEDGWIRVSYNAHKSYRPFFFGFYGGTGIIYMAEIYGNFQPDVPKIYIKNPTRGNMYFNNLSWKKSILRKFIIKRGEAIIFIGTTIKFDTSENIRNIEIYIDKKLIYNITEPPFKYYLTCEKYGIHELKTIAYNYNNNASMDIMDVITIPLN